MGGSTSRGSPGQTKISIAEVAQNYEQVEDLRSGKRRPEGKVCVGNFFCFLPF